MIRFGPAGASDSFKALGMKHTRQAPAWLRTLGLNAFEYSSGHGVQLSEETAKEIGAEAKANNISISIHAPYYIHLAQEDALKRESNFKWFRQSAQAVRAMGGNRIIFHPGSAKKEDRREAMGRALSLLEEIIAMPELDGMILCPETAGRPSQLGTVAEIIELCRIAKNILPTIDFAHLHAISRLRCERDFRDVLDPLLEALGAERMRHFHMHFSHIEFTDKGERQHRNFDDEGFGPDFAPLARVLVEYALEPVVICESRGHQTEDALAMKHMYEEALSCCTN